MIFKWLRKLITKINSHAGPGSPIYEEITNLAFPIARQEALRQLRTPLQFHATSPVPVILPTGISSDIYDLFSVGSHIQSKHGDLVFIYIYIYMKEPRPKPYLKIGTDVEHTEVWIDLTSGEAICADNEAADIEQTGGSPWLTDERYTSIWHYILIRCSQIYGYRFQTLTETATETHS